MGGKKIDRKKQALLSRAAKRQESIKKLSHKPVIKKVDIEAIKESFKKGLKTAPEINIAQHELKAEIHSESKSAEVNQKKPRKTKKEK